MKPRIVFLSASSGGGHNSAAQALINMIKKKYGSDYDYDVIDIYEDSLASNLPLAAKIRYYSDFIWKGFFSLTDNKHIVKLISSIMQPYMVKNISEKMPSHCSHLIAVHFNPAQCIEQLSKKFQQRPKTAIIVTDFDPHWGWLGQSADRIFISSESGRNKALDAGYPHNKITPLTVIPTDKIRYKKQVTQASTPLTLMLVSGKDGSNSRQIINIIEALENLPEANGISLSVYCGTNEKLNQRLVQLGKKCHRITLESHGYTQALKNQFSKADLVLIRTSPGILSECISASVPVLGFEWSAHEVYQTTLIHRHDIGKASKDINTLIYFLKRIITDREELNRLYNNVKKLRHSIDNDHLVHQLLQKETI